MRFRSRFQQHWRVHLALAVTGLVMGFLVAAFTIPALPVDWEAKAMIEVVPQAGDELSAAEVPAGVVPEERVAPWIAREIAAIGGPETREEVIEELQSEGGGKIDPARLRRILERNLTVASVRGTPALEIRVRDRDREQASRLVRELIGCYLERRTEMEQQEAEVLARELLVAEPAQEGKVRQCQIALEEVERSMLRNLDLGGTTTLLHIPESQAHKEARLALEEAEQVLLAMRGKRLSAAEQGRHAIMLLHLDKHPVALSKAAPAAGVILTVGAMAGLLGSQVIALPWNRAQAGRRMPGAGGLPGEA